MGKKRLRNMTWEDYGISKNRYKELKAFCLQYEEKKQKIEYGMNGISYAGMPGGSLFTKSPVEQQAMNNARYQKDIEMIEAAAVKTNPLIAKYLLKSVTEDLSYEFIMYDAELGRIPVGKTEFYGYRKLFYHYLNEEKIKKEKVGTN